MGRKYEEVTKSGELYDGTDPIPVRRHRRIEGEAAAARRKARVTTVWRTPERVGTEEVSRGLVAYRLPGPENGAEGQ
jgi:hypothetical protein